MNAKTFFTILYYALVGLFGLFLLEQLVGLELNIAAWALFGIFVLSGTAKEYFDE